MKKIYACGDRSHSRPRPHRNSPKNSPHATFFIHKSWTLCRIPNPSLISRHHTASEQTFGGPPPLLYLRRQEQRDPKYDCNIHKFGGGGKEGKEEPLRLYQTRRGIGRVCIGKRRKRRDASNYVWCWGKERERRLLRCTKGHMALFWR